MTLGEKLRYLREIEGSLRGLGRAMSQSEVSRGIRAELKQTISQGYLSQVENGRRRHLTESTRALLARFFNVHPGYLVTDPEGFQTELMSSVRADEDNLDEWLISGADRFAGDPEVSSALLALARHQDTRRCIVLLGVLAQLPDVVEQLAEAVRPRAATTGARKGGKRK
jgi:transcriptional regulator with XRE-family HTH domain